MKLIFALLSIWLFVAGHDPVSPVLKYSEIVITSASDSVHVEFDATFVQPSGTTRHRVVTPYSFKPESDTFVLFVASKSANVDLAGVIIGENPRNKVEGTSTDMSFFCLNLDRCGVYIPGRR